MAAFASAGRQLLQEVERELGWMYETLHTDGKTKGRIEYTVWSQIYTCPECAGEVNFVEEALDAETKRVRDAFPCPHCRAELTKQRMERLFVSKVDPATGCSLQTPKRAPAIIVYAVGKARYEKVPDQHWNGVFRGNCWRDRCGGEWPREWGRKAQRHTMKTCLVVDDLSVIRKVARRILEGLEFQIVEAEDGEKALEACKSQLPDAVLLDWNMPVMDGYDFLAQLAPDAGAAIDPR